MSHHPHHPGPLARGPAALGLRLEEVAAARRGLPQRGAKRLRERGTLASGHPADAEDGDGMRRWEGAVKMLALMRFNGI